MRNLLAIAPVLLVLAGCASRPAPPPQAEAPSYAPPPAATAAPPVATQAAPLGSLQEQFAAVAGDRVYFDLDSPRLRSDALPILDGQAQSLLANPGVRILIAGNCDERGTREYNLALGSRRAQSVADHLAARGIPAARIRTISYGKERPIDPGADESAWARNRNAHTAVEG